MNAANLCPSPRMVSDRVAELTRDIDSGIAHQNRAKFTKLAADARRKVALHIGVDTDEVALAGNTGEGNELINAGLPLEAGDEIVLWDQNHPANGAAWDVRAARFGCTLKRVSTPANPESPDQLRDVFLGAFTPRTRVVALTHVSSLTGVWLPVQEVCQEARRRGSYSHVDGAQTWGALRRNLRAIGCDSFTASAHKWPMGPKDAGVLYVRRERIARFGHPSTRRVRERSSKLWVNAMTPASPASMQRWISTPWWGRDEWRRYVQRGAAVRPHLQHPARCGGSD